MPASQGDHGRKAVPSVAVLVVPSIRLSPSAAPYAPHRLLQSCQALLHGQPLVARHSHHLDPVVLHKPSRVSFGAATRRRSSLVNPCVGTVA